MYKWLVNIIIINIIIINWVHEHVSENFGTLPGFKSRKPIQQFHLISDIDTERNTSG